MAQTIGEQLSQAREKRGLTLEQAAEETHIRVHFLQALETDQRGALPSNVQGRGFLRLYASLLELPVAPLLAAWDSAGQPGEVLTQAAVPPIQPAPPVATEAEEPQPDGFDPEPQPDSQPY